MESKFEWVACINNKAFVSKKKKIIKGLTSWEAWMYTINIQDIFLIDLDFCWEEVEKIGLMVAPEQEKRHLRSQAVSTNILVW